ATSSSVVASPGFTASSRSWAWAREVRRSTTERSSAMRRGVGEVGQDRDGWGELMVSVCHPVGRRAGTGDQGPHLNGVGMGAVVVGGPALGEGTGLLLWHQRPHAAPETGTESAGGVGAQLPGDALQGDGLVDLVAQPGLGAALGLVDQGPEPLEVLLLEGLGGGGDDPPGFLEELGQAADEVVVVGDELAKPIHGPGAGGDGVGQGDVTAAGVLVPAAQDLGDGEGDAVVVVAGGARLGGLDTADRHRQGQAGLEVDGALVAHGAEGVLHE